MYQPAAFVETRPEVLQALLREQPLGLLITPGPNADAVPFLFDAGHGPHGRLRAHVARANPLWQAADGAEVLVVFQGPQAYVSPGWYPSKAEHGKVVPTWNYVMVQARGRLRAVDDVQWLRGLVGELTSVHEAGQRAPWAPEDAPADFLATMLRAIVGIEIELTAPLAGKWKVSQNRSAADRDGVVRGLGEAVDALKAPMAALVGSHGKH
jgi:transcriptional regulator